MTTLVQRGATWLGARLKAAAGQVVTYQRKGSTAFELTGCVAEKVYELEGDDGLVTAVRSFDWFFLAADLVLLGVPFTPRPGDQISETVNGVAVTWEVLPIANQPCVEWADTSGILLVVHTKRIS